MAADQERADRIRALKQERPDLTWRRIADHVGVTERSATDWQRKGGIDFENAKKLAEIFEVDVDYIWRGTDTGTPSPFAGQDNITGLMDLIRQDMAQREQQRAEIIRRLDQLEQTVSELISEHVGDAAERLEASVAEARSILRAASQGQPRAASKRAPKRTPAA
jgi:hypothetical protein